MSSDLSVIVAIRPARPMQRVARRTCALFSIANNRNSSNQAKVDDITVNFVSRNSDEQISVQASVGQTLLDVVTNNQIDFEGFGACGGSLSCSTCHVILSQADYNKTASQLLEEELDLLDLASQVTDTSRLGCQVVLTKDLNGAVIRVPTHVNDARELSGKWAD